jgi:hypothetical protein
MEQDQLTLLQNLRSFTVLVVVVLLILERV